ncbi:GNAT family N-acetyltransferase [Qipengyuania sp. XHP0207]|uniref:GNAT family N-acetyltransferase n=1 Tax=Qipengyuania sp. XHP0207 TaxID=3038078 RepID=UPI00241FDD1A|nr:GNAT family N-acetyltransferase [Qipengyuania sp. XHP0207]MDG5747095.1 GNAT family N-acetyltransferase [Qipengyuania sp. XHP0207]
MTDIDQLMEVMESAFDPYWRESWSRTQVEGSLALPHTHAIMCDAELAPLTSGSEAAGFVLARRAPGEEELLLVAVRPEQRGKGIGRHLLDLFIESARANGADNVFLEMRENNPAESLYRAAGFAPIGRRVAYYRTASGEPLDAITFGRKL